MNNVICPTCGYENKNTNIRCENCGTRLISEEKKDKVVFETFSGSLTFFPKKSKLFIILMSIIFILFILPQIVIGSIIIVEGVDEDNISELVNGVETVGRLVEHNDNSKLYEYEYDVSGHKYFAELNSIFKPKSSITIKYDPDNPAEYEISSKFNFSTISGMLIILKAIIEFIGILFLGKLCIKKLNRQNVR